MSLRAGTFVVSSAEVPDSPDPCMQRPTATGSLELSAGTAAIREFIAA